MLKIHGFKIKKKSVDMENSTKDIKVKIETEIKKIRQKYLNSADEISRDYTEANRLAADYNGRQIYELLQNAQDANANLQNISGEVLIEFKDGVLRVSNTGEPFSFKGFKSLLRADNSPKTMQQNMIGHKGLGFRSVLSWAKEITIATKGVALEFSQSRAREFLQGLFVEKPQLKTDLKEINKDEFPIAVLTCPKIIDKKPQIPYATSIEIVCKDSVCENVSGQIESLDMLELLFLKDLSKVHIITDTENKSFVKSKSGENVVISEFDENLQSEISRTSWRLFKKIGKIEVENDEQDLQSKEVVKDYEIIIAYDFSHTYKFKENYLYSFFKTKIELNFPALIHCTFELQSNRDDLKSGNLANEKLVELLADFLAETAVNISRLNKECNYEPLKLILAKESAGGLKEYEFYELLRQKAKQKPIFPTIAKRYISLQENPKFSTTPFANVLNPASFNELLQVCDDENVKNFLCPKQPSYYYKSENLVNFYEYNEFKNRLNIDIENGFYDIKQKCELMDLVKQEQAWNYQKSYEDLYLLVDSNNECVRHKKVFIQPSENAVIKLPKCIDNVCFLNETMQEILKGSGIMSNSFDNYESFGLLEYSFNEVVSNAMKNFDINDKSAKNKNNVIAILKWLFDYYTSQNKDNDLSGVQIPALCRNGEILPANECYFGKEFDNKLGERIISAFSDDFIADLAEFKGQDRDKIVNFYEWLGAVKMPRIGNRHLETNKDKEEFLKYCFEVKPKMMTDRKEPITRDFIDSCTEIYFECVEHIDDILANAKCEDIIAWLIKDDEMQKRIKSKFEISPNSKIECKLRGIRTAIRTISGKEVALYIKYKLCNSEWIKVKDTNGKIDKMSLKNCCLADLKLEPKIYQPNINYKKLEKDFKINKKQVDELFKTLDIAESFGDFSLQSKYEILAELPNLPRGKEVARKIYSQMKEIKESEKIHENHYRETFVQDAKVLVKFNGKREFAPINEASYMDKKEFNDEILRQHKIFDLEKNFGIKKVEMIFGVKKLEISIEVEKFELANANLCKEFEKDFRHLMPYLLIDKKTNKNYAEHYLKPLQSISIQLVQSLSLNSNDTISTLKDYEMFYGKKNKKLFIKVPENANSLKELKESAGFTDIVAEAIGVILDTNAEKMFYQLLFEGNHLKRDFMAREKDENLETLNAIKEDLNIKQDKRAEFWQSIAFIKKLNANEKQILRDFEISQASANALDYEDLQNENNAKFFFEIFKKLGIGISLFNEHHAEQIDISEYLKREFNKLKSEYKNAYIYCCYELCKHSKETNKFEYLVAKYNSTQVQIPNSIVNLEQIFENHFGFSVENLKAFKGLNIETIINENKEKYSVDLLKKLEQKFGKAKLNNHLLFDSIDELDKELKQDLEKDAVIKPQNSAREKLEKARNLAKNATYTPITQITKVQNSAQKITQNATISQNKNYINSRPRVANETSDLNDIKEIHGLAGEIAVYEKLCEIHSKDKVSWLSLNAEKEGEIPQGQGDDSLGYDMKYIDENGVEFFVEVKASNLPNIEFFMSKNELDFALSKAKYYELWFVHLQGEKQAKITNLGTIFDFKDGENLHNNSQFIIKTENCKISVK